MELTELIFPGYNNQVCYVDGFYEWDGRTGVWIMYKCVAELNEGGIVIKPKEANECFVAGS